jgi:formylglycine-generating enzyme required for sulfatase activity
LYDVCGNASEWVSDYSGTMLPAGTHDDPAGPSSGVTYLIRGDTFGDEVGPITSARGSGGADFSHIGCGLRVVREVSTPSSSAPSSRP